jgi:short-subunit dehydrogenase
LSKDKERIMSSRVVVITGASGGIGAATARLLAARGDKLMLAARREAELVQVAEQCGAGARFTVADVTRHADVEHLRDEALVGFGQVDVWINNAGRGINRPVLELTDEDFDQMMAVNAKSALYGMQVIIPHFKERNAGHLINIASVLGRIPFASNRSAYNAAKAALISLSTCLRMDLRANWPGIHVSVVMPATVLTDFPRHALHAPPGTPGGPPPGVQAQTPEQAAAAIVDLIDKPRAECYTMPAMAEVVERYYADVEAFEGNSGR